MIAETYLDHEENLNLSVLKVTMFIKMITNFLILGDAFLKTISYGAFYDENSYFQDLWQTLDFIYIISYFILQLTSENIP
jgi:hypothetical protein